MADITVIKPIWRGKGAAAPTARALSGIAHVFRHIRGENGIIVHLRNDRLVIRGNPVAPAEEFGIASIAKNIITVLGGSIILGNVKYSVGDTEVGVSEATDVIGWQINYESLALTICMLGATWAPTAERIICPLWNVAYDGESETASIVSKASRMVYPANMGQNPS